MNTDSYKKFIAPESISVVISYSSRSHKYIFDQLVRDLMYMKKSRKLSYKLEIFTDQNINAGEHFVSEISKYFEDADVIICMVTNKFFEVDFIEKYEKKIIKEKAREFRDMGIGTVVPVIISHHGYNYIDTWLGGLNLATTPKRFGSIVGAQFVNDAWADIEKTLDSTFRKFQNTIVKNRTAGNFKPKNDDESNGAFVFVFLFLLGLLAGYMISRNSEPIQQVPCPTREPCPTCPECPDEPRNSPIGRTNRPESYEENSSRGKRVDACSEFNDKGSIFPRLLSSYEYYGKTPYGIYESCQGLNINGYKPCKRNRRWYIVNEDKGIDMLINVEESVHEEIYAVRPLLDDIAEVYYHNGEYMYLSFCISLNDMSRLLD